MMNIKDYGPKSFRKTKNNNRQLTIKVTKNLGYSLSAKKIWPKIYCHKIRFHNIVLEIFGFAS